MSDGLLGAVSSEARRALPDGSDPVVLARLAPSDRLLVASLLAIGLLVRVAVVIATRHHWQPLNDALDYNRIAASLASGHGYGNAVVPPARGASAFRPPLYPFLLAPVYWLFGVSLTMGRLENAVIGTAAVAAIGLLAFQLWGRRVALVALGVAAVYPPLILASFGLQYEALLIFLTCLSLSAGLQFNRHPEQWKWFALAGLLAGLGVLTRENASVLLVPLALLAWGATKQMRRLLPRVALIVVCCFGLVLPWTVRNALRLHSFVPVSTSLGYAVEGSYNNTSAHYPGDPTLWLPPTNDPATVRLLYQTKWSEPAIDVALRSAAIRYVRAHPVYPLEVVAWNTIRVFDLHGFKDSVFIASYIPYNVKLVKAAVVSFYLIGLLALIGAFTTEARRVPRAIWLFPVLEFVTLVTVTANLRYRSVLEPFFVMLAAIAIVRLWEARMRLRSRSASTESR